MGFESARCGELDALFAENRRLLAERRALAAQALALVRERSELVRLRLELNEELKERWNAERATTRPAGAARRW
jgi:hypothetical protein